MAKRFDTEYDRDDGYDVDYEDAGYDEAYDDYDDEEIDYDADYDNEEAGEDAENDMDHEGMSHGEDDACSSDTEDALSYEQLPDAGSRRIRRSVRRAQRGSLPGKLSRSNRLILYFCAAVLFLAIAAGGMYARAKFAEAKIAELATVGTQLEGIEVIGDEGLLAVADVRMAKLAAAELVLQEEPAAEEPQKEYKEIDHSQKVTVTLKMVSVQRDLKIKFVNKSTDKLIPNVPFSVTVKTADKKTVTWTDDDMDGIIYQKDITPGEYKVEVNTLSDDSYAGYILPTEVQKAEVKKNIDYRKIDVSDEVKTESQINLATEEQKKQGLAVESALEDTVAWVESSSTPDTYTEVSKSDIDDPGASDTNTTVSAGDAVSEDDSSALTDKDGNELYVSEDGSYRTAVYADYYKDGTKFYKQSGVKYTGWQTLDGNLYYFTESGEKVTGEQIIQGAKYNFADDGALIAGSGTVGIDVSKHNGSIDWSAVKNSGVSYVIIRCGYRGYTQGSLIIDPTFDQNIKGATAAGLNVGVYFFSQAVDEVEAVEEASFVLDVVSGYKITYPIFLDVEYSGAAGNAGRADGLDRAVRTAVCRAFCATVQSGGYTAGVYANKTWLETKIDPGQLGAYKIWLAQYAAEPTYGGRYDMWQYKSTGQVNGINGNVDMNISYLGY